MYIGKYYYNRRRFKKIKGEKTKGGNPKKTYEYRNEDEWLMVPIPSIVDHAVFEMARQQKINNVKKAGNVKYEYLLKSKIKCAICGRKWNATTYTGNRGENVKRYTCYRCPNHSPKRYGEGVERCPASTIRADLLDNYVWGIVMEFLSDPAEYVAQMHESIDFISEELHAAVVQLEEEIKVRDKEMEKVKTLFKHCIINEEEMLVDFHKLKDERNVLNEEIQKYHRQLENAREVELSTGRITEFTSRVRHLLRTADSS